MIMILYCIYISLVFSDVEIDQRDVDGLSAVMVAAVYGSEQILEGLLSRGANVALSDKNESNILHLAAENKEDESMMVRCVVCLSTSIRGAG